MEEGKVEEAPVRRWEIDSVHRRMERMEKKIRIIIALLVEKKLLGPTLQKAIEETLKEEQADKSKIEWYLKQLEIE